MTSTAPTGDSGGGYLCPQKLGSAIRTQREQLHLSQTEAADEIGIAQHELSRIELGRQLPRLERFARVCNALELVADIVIEEARL